MRKISKKISGTCFRKEQLQLSSTGFLCVRGQGIRAGVNIWTARASLRNGRLDWAAEKSSQISCSQSQSVFLAQTLLDFFSLHFDQKHQCKNSWVMISLSVGKKVWMVGYDNLCAWLALPRIKCVPAASLLYIYVLWNTSDFFVQASKHYF